MTRNILQATVATLLLAVLTGLVYPLAMTALAQLAFHGKAEGSLVRAGGRVAGSELIGQEWQGAKWFYGRPSAAGYDAAASSGSNLGPNSKDLAGDIRKRAAAIIAAESPYRPGVTVEEIPADLLTASASGLDPDVTPQAAEFQAPRVAASRGLDEKRVRGLIRAHTTGRFLGFIGEPRVNVLELNLALEKLR